MFLHFLRFNVYFHLIVLVSHLIGQTACPSLNLVQGVFFLVVTSLANIDLFVSWKVTRPTFAVSGNEHNEAPIYNLIDLVISILSSFDNFIVKEMLIKAMNCLFRSIIPASIYPFSACGVLPSAIDLSD